MSHQITTAFVNNFRDNIMHLVQQKGSRLRNAVYVKTGVVGEYFYQEQLGATAAVKNVTRHADTPLIDSAHYRRRGTMWDFDWADLIDTQDKFRMLIDPTSDYAQNAADAMARSMDDEIITAFGATAYAGKAGGTSVAFGVDMDGSTALSPVFGGVTCTNQTVPANASGATGNMGITKLRAAKYILDLNEVDEEDRFIVVGASQLASLLSTTSITSVDYNQVKALVNGDIDTFLGFKFIQSQRLPKSGNNRTCYAWQKKGMCLAVGQEWKTDIGPRRDKRNATQVYVTMTVGSVRLEERRVVAITCDETASMMTGADPTS